MSPLHRADASFPGTSKQAKSHSKIQVNSQSQSNSSSSLPFCSCGVNDAYAPEGYGAPTPPYEKVKNYEVYIGFCGHNSSVARFADWLRAELELQGVLCFATDRGRCSNAHAHAMAKAAMDAPTLGLVIITSGSFCNPYTMEELNIFLQKKKLIPILFDLSRGDCVVEDIIQRNGRLWQRKGGKLWRRYGGLEDEWQQIVDRLSRSNFMIETDQSNWRDCILMALDYVGRKLGRRNIVESIEKWKEHAKREFPFPRNGRFIGREEELLKLKKMLFGYTDKTDDASSKSNSIEGKGHIAEVLNIKVSRNKKSEGTDATTNSEQGGGIVCVTGETGIGKRELMLEFAYRYSQRYKMVLWIGGCMRYFRRNYIKLLSPFGLDTLLEAACCQDKSNEIVFAEVEDLVVETVRKQLMRDIPFLLVIDNLDDEKDWWNGKNIMEFLPRNRSATHVIISTTLPGVMHIQSLNLQPLHDSDAMQLITGGLVFKTEEAIDSLKIIIKKLGNNTFALCVVSAILHALPVSPCKLLEYVDKRPCRDCSHINNYILTKNPFLVQLLDLCLLIFDIADGSRKLASSMVKTSSSFAPSPIPDSLLESAARKISDVCLNKCQRSCLERLSSVCLPSQTKISGSSILVRFHMAKQCSEEGFIQFHDIIRLYARIIENTKTSLAVVRTINIEGRLPQHFQHVWSACFLLFKFGTEPASVDLKVAELISFIKRLLIPLALETCRTLRHYDAAQLLLGQCIEKLECLDESFLAHSQKNMGGSYCFGTSRDEFYIRFNPKSYEEFAMLRAELFERKAELMAKGGMHDIEEILTENARIVRESISQKRASTGNF